MGKPGPASIGVCYVMLRGKCFFLEIDVSHGIECGEDSRY